MIRIYLRSLSLLIFSLIAACDHRHVVTVTRVGELENLIRDGDLSSHARLEDFKDQNDLYAIGTVTNNEGFITILGGRSFTSYVDTNKNARIDSSYNAEATLLLYSHVEKWKPFEIPKKVITWKQLEQLISNQANKYNVSRTKAFPFMLEGTAAELNWHVLNWRPNIKEITYKKILTLGVSGRIADEKIVAIGFYSKDPKEIFVHQETVLHIHFINEKHTLSGRIENMKLDGRMTLYLPADPSD